MDRRREEGPRRALHGARSRGPRVLLDLDENALARALLGGLDHGVVHPSRDVRQTLGPTRVAEDLVAFLDVRQPIVEQREYCRCDLFAQAVTRTKILINPDLHKLPSPLVA